MRRVLSSSISRGVRVVAVLSRCPSPLVRHSAACFSQTGISFQKLSKSDAKILDYNYRQEQKFLRDMRMKLVNRLLDEHAANPPLTKEKCRELLTAAKDKVTEMEAREMWFESMRRFAPYLITEVKNARRELVEKTIDQIFADLRAEIKRGEKPCLSKLDALVRMQKILGEDVDPDDLSAFWDRRFEVSGVDWTEPQLV